MFIRHRRPLLRTLQRMVGNPSTAEDLLQDTWLRVTRALARSPIEHLEPFLFQTARNLARDHLRARRLREHTLIEDVPDTVLHDIAQSGSTLDQAAHAERLLLRLSADIARLSRRQQQVFSLSRLHGHSCGDIAEYLEVSTSTVQKELKLITEVCAQIAQRLNQ
nr:sigma-70 family RNA polymerase sigma factor [Pseudomonas sp. dw_358]